MGAMQKKVMGAIKEAAKEAGLDCVVNPNWANTGTIFFQLGFDTVLSCAYDFQDRYACLQFYPSGVQPVMCCGFTHKECVHSAYIKYEDMGKRVAEMLDFIKSKGKVAA
jgi:hypothetical protein